MPLTTQDPGPHAAPDSAATQCAPISRRRLLGAWAGASLVAIAPPALGQGAPDMAIDALRKGGVVVAFRHAQAPGTFDPPGMRLDQCSTQRNLDDAGREQARRLGAWFRAHDLRPAVVRSSPWCRCLDTARLAFGEALAWDQLGSPRRTSDDTAQVVALRRGLAAVPAGQFEVWVSHQFTLSALVGGSTAAAEGLVLQAAPADAAPRLLARLAPP
jgi:phosphohistidine phosphatase SixA